MMWRWEEMPEPIIVYAGRVLTEPCGRSEGMKYIKKEPVRPPEVGKKWEYKGEEDRLFTDFFWHEPAVETAARRCGYCGLAGRPE
jgi:hypothetical protein